jgi:voltage-gated potassium channel Kch
VIGYGRFGQTVAQMLMAKGISLTSSTRSRARSNAAAVSELKVYYGDGTRLDLLRAAGRGGCEGFALLHRWQRLDARKLEPVLEAFRRRQSSFE